MTFTTIAMVVVGIPVALVVIILAAKGWVHILDLLDGE